ncbi:hypothetical protein I7I53_03707 [Histoplasma capsulatum var. duboisii H88]|uniref:Uncharacterized protein n=1 Tax=Ajellomyces capsulatus (strain H88) TaxID=544711 RepID=A0A8A1LUW6_AJEC8|nr:hypothetical protein I7I53_03707 [Histoplasma capsulatum var. duboisii H88]
MSSFYTLFFFPEEEPIGQGFYPLKTVQSIHLLYGGRTVKTAIACGPPNNPAQYWWKRLLDIYQVPLGTNSNIFRPVPSTRSLFFNQNPDLRFC